MTDSSLRDWWEELFQVHEFAHYQEYAEELTRREVDFLEQALPLTGVETILDLACGGGRHAIELARRGYTVEGIDAAAPVIAYAQQRAQELGTTARFAVGDMRTYADEERFDVVLVMNSSIGFFDDATNRTVLTNAARALAPGGKLLLQCLNPYQIATYLQTFRTGWYQLGQGYVLRQSHFDPRSATLLIDYRYLDPAQGLEVVHPGDRIRLYGFPELTALLEQVGLRPHSVFGDALLPPVPFDEESQWQVVVARKELPSDASAAADTTDEPAANPAEEPAANPMAEDSEA
jgi:2-polyprenyl-3-methyl-5-hydroxy-6-metoxy-1,4-benzoquinol methylase